MSSTSVIKQRIHQAVAEAVLSEIQSKQARWYYFLGKTLEFQGGDVETPLSNLAYEAQTRNDMIAIKAINAGDVSFIIPRIEWTSGTVYDMYDDQEDEEVLDEPTAHKSQSRKESAKETKIKPEVFVTSL